MLRNTFSTLKHLENSRETISKLFPGVLLAATIAGAATFLSEHYGTPVMLLALLLGMAFNFLSEDKKCSPGIEFSAINLLRLGIILLGARITLEDISSLGASAFITVILLLCSTIALGFLVCKFLNKDWRFALLTGGSVAICGASAALAIAAVIPKNDKTDRNTLFTIVAVTTLSTFAMVLYPILFAALDLNDRETGFLIGATIHDVAQVIGAGYSVSTEAGDIATIVKLLRVVMLPVILILILLLLPASTNRSAKPQLPFFVVGFLIVVALNSFHLIPEVLVNIMTEASRWLLVITISALGVKTSMQKMLQLGFSHIAVVLINTILLLAMAILSVQFILDL